MLTEFLSFPNTARCIRLRLHPLPMSAAANSTAAVRFLQRLRFNQTLPSAAQTNPEGGEKPPSEHLQYLLFLLLPILWPAAANRRGQDPAYLITSATIAMRQGCSDTLQKVPKSCSNFLQHKEHRVQTLTTHFLFYSLETCAVEYIFHLPLRLALRNQRNSGIFAHT